MRIPVIATSSLAFAFAGVAFAANSVAPPVSGPVVHGNLALYFVHGASRPGPAPLTLQEALAMKTVEVRETGSVNSLQIENLGDNPVFVQAGDVVKGGRQDRTLQMSLLLPSHSGSIPIASFCVEHGRWTARNTEDPTKFEASVASVPSREMKMAMEAPLPATAGASGTGVRQQRVWDGVAKAQDRLGAAVGGTVRSTASETSLQLALENQRLAKLREDYVKALHEAGEKDGDITGYVFAVNGKINSGEVYESNALFRKMWPKLLDASATEAISHHGEEKAAPPAVNDVAAFLADSDRGTASVMPLNFGVSRATRESAAAYSFETASAAGWVHRGYLAK